MITCIQCQTELAVTDAKAARRMRCANCGSLFSTGQEGTKVADRLAWRSLWLGLASILLICFTGIPAIYYGVRSLLKMRHSPSRKGDQAAAAIGTVLGLFFSLFGSLVLVMIGAVLSVAFFMTDRSTEPDVVIAMQESICTLELPTRLKPEKSVEVMGQFQMAHFHDHPENDRATARVVVAKIAPQFEFNRVQFSADIKGLNLYRNWPFKTDKSEKEDLTWSLNGKDVSVTKTTETYVDSDIETVRYVMFLERKHEEGKVDEDLGIAIVLRQPNKHFDEEAVKEIFASFGPSTLDQSVSEKSEDGVDSVDAE